MGYLVLRGSTTGQGPLWTCAWAKLHPPGKKLSIEEQIQEYIACQPAPKRSDLQFLHDLILKLSSGTKLWFTDGMSEEGKVVANPSIGFGQCTIKYADGTMREFYRIGLSANKTGISVYVLGLEDKTYLSRTFGNAIGKARVTGYCIKFKTLTDIDVDVLQEAIRYGFVAG